MQFIVWRMDKQTLLEIDRRALSSGMTLSDLAGRAGVGKATMAKLRKDPSSVRPRSFSKLLNTLDAIEREKAK